jgi:parvulin-like peptidyl-prolyl isomerase
VSVLAIVNEEPIDVATAVRLSLLHDAKFMQETVGNLLVRQYAEKQGIRNSDAELQLAADELRYSRGLESVERLDQWMRENNQTPLAIQEGIDFMLLHNKVRNAIPDSQVAAHFAEHQLELETAELYSIRADSEAKASELLAQITDEGANFHVLAMEHSRDESSRHLGGYVGRLTRGQMTGAIEAAVFKAKPGSVIGPVKTEKGWNLFKVAAIHKPSLEEAKSAIRVTLMQQLTQKLLADARIDYPVFREEASPAQG